MWAETSAPHLVNRLRSIFATILNAAAAREDERTRVLYFGKREGDRISFHLLLGWNPFLILRNGEVPPADRETYRRVVSLSPASRIMMSSVYSPCRSP